MGGRGRADQPRAPLVELASPVAEPVLVQLEARPAERVGLDEIRAGVEVGPVDVPDDVGMRVVPELGAGAVREASREQHRAVASVEDQQLAGPHAREPLPAPACAHRRVLP